jgi:menaquinone-dependent protoporphyrinogen IX oxidase
MKTIIIYTSQTGFTKRYAEWIAEKSNADIFELKEAQKKEASFFDTYDAVIYAGWCMAGKVVKSNWFFDKAASLKGKKLAVVAVGASPNENPQVDEAMAALLTAEQKQYIKVFYCQGGINYDKMKLPSKLAMKMFASSLKKSKDPKQREQGAFIDHSYDVADIKFIEPVIAFLGE